MAAVVTMVLFLIGICIGTLSVYSVIKKKATKFFYAIPFIYTFLVVYGFEKIHGYAIDVAALIFFSVAILIISWAIVKYEM